MTSLRIEMDRGNGWELRSEGETSLPVALIRDSLPPYAIQYPHRALVGAEHLIVVPAKGKLTQTQIMECHAYAGDNGATIEFLRSVR